ncbi:hypothetical protein Poli38472_011317 [Pythium oligandrum]|uniref:Long-chain-fatty-acid--CoA ligase n=1 Tax=Pythium oligandrum TaxID=41045 RepID=A0A8K1FQ89_PYTOL|nr:hypothetical protein Poli38472_011317 [Pythium oligandrum]|eukprot:TMW67697.1 hypothetical protein Poli38472_011317 [Pythium oligandrum]
MGGSYSTEELPAPASFSQEVANTKEATRGAIRVTKPCYADPKTLTLYENFRLGLAMDRGLRRCYGTRAVADGQPGEYEWMTFADVAARSETIASGLTKFAGLQRQGMVGIFSKNRVEWCLTAHACDRMSYILVPLYDTLGPDAVPYILNHTELTTLVCAREQFDTVLKCKDACPSLQYVVQYEQLTEKQRQQAQEKNVIVKSLSEIEDLGKNHPIAAEPPTPEDIATICYTSGTTGNPKGAVLLHNSMTQLGVITVERLGLHSDMVHISYLPLPHVFERAFITASVRLGAAAGFYRGDVLTLMDDIAALQPTIFVSVPRLFNRIYDKITQGVAAAGGIKQALFEQAYAAKKAALADGYKTHAFWDMLVFNKIRQVLGGRVTFMLSGSAPLSAEVKEFMAIVFSCDVVEGYGLTETAAGLTIASADMGMHQHIGAPLPNIEVRLEDVPEMGYTSDDKPCARGEILCRGPTVFAGYYKDPEMTAEVLEKDGWLHTGDIGCWNEDGTLSIIDRKKNIFKLSQGEYVAAEKLEGIYLKSKYIAQIFVYGDSFQSALVGVAVPDPVVTEVWGVSQGRSKEDSTVAKLVLDPEFQKEVMTDLVRIGKQEQLRGFEFVKKLYLCADPFSLEQGLTTPTFKLKRPQLKAHFQKELDAMYAVMNQ